MCIPYPRMHEGHPCVVRSMQRFASNGDVYFCGMLGSEALWGVTNAVSRDDATCEQLAVQGCTAIYDHPAGESGIRSSSNISFGLQKPLETMTLAAGGSVNVYVSHKEYSCCIDVAGAPTQCATQSENVTIGPFEDAVTITGRMGPVGSVGGGA